MKSKTIILSSQKKFTNNSPRAIITFIQNNQTLEGKLRLYNLNSLTKTSKLGIFYENQVYTTNLIQKEDSFCFYLNENFNLDNNIYCAIIDKGNNNEVVLCGGTTQNFNYTLEEESEDKNNKCKSNSLNNNMEENNFPTDNSTSTNDCNACENCIYKEYFFAHKNEKELENLKSLSTEDSLNTEKQNILENDYDFSENKDYDDIEKINVLNKESEKFLQSITDQLDDMFKTYPEDKTIMQIIPNSKIIKVTDTIDEDSYIVGVIYEENEIKYLLYGVPSKYNNPAPKEFGDNYQWLPLNAEDPLSDGYYLLYQDASSGKIVPIIVE